MHANDQLVWTHRFRTALHIQEMCQNSEHAFFDSFGSNNTENFSLIGASNDPKDIFTATKNVHSLQAHNNYNPESTIKSRFKATQPAV